MTSTSKRYCSVPQCNSYVSREISLHYFPIRNLKLCKTWKEVLKIGKPISKYMNVCSQHFVESDFIKTAKGDNVKVRRLKPTAIPSQNLPTGTHEKAAVKPRKTKNSSLALNKSSTAKVDNTEETLPNNELGQTELEQVVPDLFITVQNHEEETEQIIPEKVFVDKGTQTVDPGEWYSLEKILNTDEKLKAFTSVDSRTLKTLCECANEVAEYNSKTVQNLTLRVMLVLIKIRLNIPFSCLAILFHLSASSVSRYFYSTLSLLSISIEPIIYWPTRDEILANLPKCFKDYQNTRVVLDCTEIQLDRCKCLKCRILTYSHYKGRHTVKFLIGITPSGTISYVSSGYGGRTSDKAIFNREGIIKMFNPCDGIMVDKGILIEKECEENFLKLIRPPFLRKQKQFSKADAEETANIARARVHVERAIERMKSYSILHGQIPWYMAPYTNEIMTVVAGLVNLSRPILADDKFIHFDVEENILK